jgi:hypothetical protein
LKISKTDTPVKPAENFTSPLSIQGFSPSGEVIFKFDNKDKLAEKEKSNLVQTFGINLKKYFAE